MIRILHTACVGALVGVALVAYGVKEEIAALDRKVVELKEQRAALHEAIQRERAEWAYLNSPAVLDAIATRVFGAGRYGSAENTLLSPWRPEQLVELRDLPMKSGRDLPAQGYAVGRVGFSPSAPALVR